VETRSMEKEQEEKLESIYQKSVAGGDNIITVLQEIQKVFGYVPEDSVTWFSKRLNIPASKFYGVITFYSQFHLTPRGKNIVTVCSGTVCHVKGAPRIIEKLASDLKLKGDVRTTKDKLFTLENVNCVGACSIAPVVIVNEKVYGKQSPDSMVKNLKTYKE
jgi:NADH:ubiquinone oxidoreductase subunit E